LIPGALPENLPALRRIKFFLRCALAVLVFTAGEPAAGAEEWYVSNAGGMALEKALSRYAALRQPYSLLVDASSPAALPDLLVPYYQESWTIELRVLYRDGVESRSQWVFRDNRDVSRLVAAFTVPPDDEAAPYGFVEVYGENGLITAERQLSEEGEELTVEYRYSPVPPAASTAIRELLIRSDTRRKYFDGEGLETWEDVCTDYYRYTRNLSLRQIERVYHQNAGESAMISQLRFPRRSLDSTAEENFVAPVLAYGSQFLEDIQADAPYRVVYTTDERGRILEERRMDSEDNVIGELRNVWADNRIVRVIWKSGEEERVTEYEYNSGGDRVKERNLNNGILERVVYINGDKEDEELYMNGEVILRAQWERGRKIREERVPSGRGRQP
jgi:hypothetical protein